MAHQLDKINQIWYSDWYEQQAKKQCLSERPELVDFAIGLVNPVLTLPYLGQVKFLANSNYRRTEINAHWKIFTR